MKDGRVQDLRQSLAEAPVAAQPERDAPAPDAAGGGATDDGPPAPGRPRGAIWDGCPVQPLGVHGDVSWYIDVRGQLRGVDNHTQQKMLHVFGGRTGVLAHHFPVYGRSGQVQPGRFDAQRLSAAMIAACEELGVWSPVGRVRGPGAWTDEDGGLILHAGDAVLVDGEWRAPGVHRGHVYPASDPVPRPRDEPGKRDPAEELLELVQTWQWSRPDIDPQLVLGVVCAQMMGGALEWRPVTWLTGDAATGKSAFQRMLLYLHGGEAGLLQAADATEAGIRSVVGYSALPVAIDELEPDPERPHKTKGVVELARRASSGAQIFRGSADQKGHQSNAFSAFLFSSILVPDMPAQDRSRLILLDLERLPDTAPTLSLEPRALRRVGAGLRRRLVDRWPTWPERLELWRAALARHGQTGRAADNFGTALALADLALRADLPDGDVLTLWAGKIASAITEDASEVGSNAEDMLVHLLSQPLDVWRRGQRHTVAQWVAMGARLPGAPEVIEAADATNVNQYLAPYGLRVYGHRQDAALAIATKPLQGLRDLFHGSLWADGVWSQAARRVPGAEPVNMTLAGVATRGQRIPLSALPGMLNFPMDRPAGPERPPEPPDMDDFA